MVIPVYPLAKAHRTNGDVSRPWAGSTSCVGLLLSVGHRLFRSELSSTSYEGRAMPGPIDANTTARLRLEMAEHLLEERVSQLEDTTAAEGRRILEQAIESLDLAAQALQAALGEYPPQAPTD
jgi:hypothetical protein